MALSVFALSTCSCEQVSTVNSLLLKGMLSFWDFNQFKFEVDDFYYLGKRLAKA